MRKVPTHLPKSNQMIKHNFFKIGQVENILPPPHTSQKLIIRVDIVSSNIIK